MDLIFGRSRVICFLIGLTQVDKDFVNKVEDTIKVFGYEGAALFIQGVEDLVEELF